MSDFACLRPRKHGGNLGTAEAGQLLGLGGAKDRVVVHRATRVSTQGCSIPFSALTRCEVSGLTTACRDGHLRARLIRWRIISGPAVCVVST